MMYISGKDYDSTKLIKQGALTLDPSFAKFAQWVFEEFGVKPINIVYDNIDPHNSPRLNLIFERQDQAQIFHSKDDPGYQEIKRKAVTDKFKELTTDPEKKEQLAEISSSNIWVIFQEFEPAAKSACNESIPEAMIADFKSKFPSDLLAEVVRFGAFTTFFFYTASQWKESKMNGLQQEIKKAYLELLKTFDEFDYFTMENMLVVFDSKESG